jgi:predicted Zn-dependent protease
MRPQLPWTFKIIDTKDVNAFALPGGPVYVTKGLLDLEITDSELAGVLGHESAHVNQRHSVKAIQQAMTLALVSDIALKNANDMTRMAVEIALQVGIQLPHSRADEYEADALGVRIAYNAFYPAAGLGVFLRRLDALPDVNKSPEWMQDHPATKARVARSDRIAAEVAAMPRPVAIALSEYDKKVIKNLPAASSKGQ